MKTRDMILISLFAALVAIGAFIKIPIGPVPFSMQFVFCAFAGVFLGSKKGGLSVLLYVIIGLIGIPVFTKGGGPTYVFQPTFGYLIGFILAAFIIGFITERIEKPNAINVTIACLAGLAVVYVIGVAYLFLIVNVYMGTTAFTFSSAIAAGFTPFIIPDLFWSFLVGTSSVYIIPRLRKAGYLQTA